ncbi:hypothetical protein [Moraxella oculi]|uniref:Toxin CptA n=1 Tax=Moraxella oculi TaxID=2940516 RepID=A0ABW8U6J6_9GAMM
MPNPNIKSTIHHHSKNRLHLELVLHRRGKPFVWSIYVLTTLLLALWADLSWWMMGIVSLMAVLLSVWLAYQVRPLTLNCHHIDEAWEIGVATKRGRALWQGYLTQAQVIGTPNKSVFLRFYVIEPSRCTMEVIIRRHQVSDENFRKLLGVCAMNAAGAG